MKPPTKFDYWWDYRSAPIRRRFYPVIVEVRKHPYMRHIGLFLVGLVGMFWIVDLAAHDQYSLHLAGVLAERQFAFNLGLLAGVFVSGLAWWVLSFVRGWPVPYHPLDYDDYDELLFEREV